MSPVVFRPQRLVQTLLWLGLTLFLLLSLAHFTAWAQSAPVVVAAGDIACSSDSPFFNGAQGKNDNCQMAATAELVVAAKPQTVLALGDNQYEKGELEGYQRSYEPTWGRFKNRTKPVAGNHEYYTADAKGYYDYFGSLAGDRRRGYYSFNLGAWHLIALNSNCEAVGGCGVGSPQEKWLQADLKANKRQCTLAYWHHPRYSSGIHGNNQSMEAFWQDLQQAKAELVLSGHDHDYERFAPQKGLRQFVVGTGGKNLYPFKKIQPQSEAHSDEDYGVLKLVLKPASYEWQYVATATGNFRDQGQSPCQ
jgi:3',5'-cyclic AMP phosphodiesterase CpdA